MLRRRVTQPDSDRHPLRALVSSNRAQKVTVRGRPHRGLFTSGLGPSNSICGRCLPLGTRATAAGFQGLLTTAETGTPCRFCDACIRGWLTRNTTKTCPKCREVCMLTELRVGRQRPEEPRDVVVDLPEFNDEGFLLCEAKAKVGMGRLVRLGSPHVSCRVSLAHDSRLLTVVQPRGSTPASPIRVHWPRSCSRCWSKSSRRCMRRTALPRRWSSLSTTVSHGMQLSAGGRRAAAGFFHRSQGISCQGIWRPAIAAAPGKENSPHTQDPPCLSVLQSRSRRSRDTSRRRASITASWPPGRPSSGRRMQRQELLCR